MEELEGSKIQSAILLSKNYLYCVFLYCKIHWPTNRFKVKYDWFADWNSSYGTEIKVNIITGVHPLLRNPIQLI